MGVAIHGGELPPQYYEVLENGVQNLRALARSHDALLEAGKELRAIWTQSDEIDEAALEKWRLARQKMDDAILGADGD